MLRLALITSLVITVFSVAQPITIGFYNASFDSDGNLLAQSQWEAALQREVGYYKLCPRGSLGAPSSALCPRALMIAILSCVGYNNWPIFVYNTFLGPKCDPQNIQIIPGMHNGMGILSYLKYYDLFGRSDPFALEVATAMGDYVCDEALTAPIGKYPSIPRSSGINLDFPIKYAAQVDALFGGASLGVYLLHLRYFLSLPDAFV